MNLSLIKAERLRVEALERDKEVARLQTLLEKANEILATANRPMVAIEVLKERTERKLKWYGL